MSSAPLSDQKRSVTHSRCQVATANGQHSLHSVRHPGGLTDLWLSAVGSFDTHPTLQDRVVEAASNVAALQRPWTGRRTGRRRCHPLRTSVRATRRRRFGTSIEAGGPRKKHPFAACLLPYGLFGRFGVLCARHHTGCHGPNGAMTLPDSAVLLFVTYVGPAVCASDALACRFELLSATYSHCLVYK